MLTFRYQLLSVKRISFVQHRNGEVCSNEDVAFIRTRRESHLLCAFTAVALMCRAVLD